MTSQAQLLPSLYALLPADQLELMLARLSLAAIHVEPYHIRDSVYANTSPVIPGQHRTLRLRGRRRRRRRAVNRPASQRWAGAVDDGDIADAWEYSVAWMSMPLQGREYADMHVQACIALEVAGKSSREDIEEFVETMGFRHSHTTARAGHLFHLPVSGYATTLHLSVTRVLGDDGAPAKTNTSEPYLVQLQPAKPVSSVAPRGELTLQDAMRIMQDTAGRVEGLKWETGLNRDSVKRA